MENKDSNLSRRFYKWHRILGFIALVPIIGWTISGLSHPLMSNWLRPFLPVETYQLPALSNLKPVLSLPEVLDKNHLTEFRNFGLASINKQTYYQVLQKDSTYSYYSATNGMLLPGADQAYAVQLARYFTEDSVAKIKSITKQTVFDGKYQPINRLLPVWKVSFDRPDGMDIYIESSQSRMGTFNNNTRKFFLQFFEQLHTWEFVADTFGDQFRLILMACVVGLLFLSMLSGLIIYGIFWQRFKAIARKRKQNKVNEKRWAHRYHRQLGLIMSFIMLMFFTSAGFHLLVKLHNLNSKPKQYVQLIRRSDLKVDNLKLAIADTSVIKQGIVQMYGQTYYQLTDKAKTIRYFNTANGKEKASGDQEYAEYLAYFYRQLNVKETTHAQLLTSPVKQFNNEYGFINKRLPVQKISYPGNDNWYIETTTSKLATHVAGIDRAEGLAFIFLHKFFWATWAGKDIRDMISMLAALGILLTALFGLVAFIKNK